MENQKNNLEPDGGRFWSCNICWFLSKNYDGASGRKSLAVEGVSRVHRVLIWGGFVPPGPPPSAIYPSKNVYDQPGHMCMRLLIFDDGFKPKFYLKSSILFKGEATIRMKKWREEYIFKEWICHKKCSFSLRCGLAGHKLHASFILSFRKLPH